jgi:hypothetical protein
MIEAKENMIEAKEKTTNKDIFKEKLKKEKAM